MRAIFLLLSLVLAAAVCAAADSDEFCPPPPPICDDTVLAIPAQPAPKKLEWVEEEYVVQEGRCEEIEELRTRTRTHKVEMLGPEKRVFDSKIAQVVPVNGKATRLARGGSPRKVATFKTVHERYEETYLHPTTRTVFTPVTKTRKVAREVEDDGPIVSTVIGEEELAAAK